jgi:hypothetical protein
MNDERAIEHRISAWLEGEASGSLPDRVLESVFAETRVAARRGGPFDGRFRHVSRLASGLVAAGAAAVILVFGASLLGSKGPATSSPGPSASSAAVIYPTPAPYQTNVEPTVQPRPSAQSEAIDATAFSAPFTMTWPTTVKLPWIKPDSVQVQPRYGTSFNVLLVGRVGTDPCHSTDLTATALKTPQELMDWLAAIPHVAAGPVSAVTLGGKPGLQRDTTVSPLTDCLDIQNLHTGIRTSLDNGYPGGFYLGTGQARWIAMTVGGKLIVVIVTPLTSPAFMADATQAMSTLRFAP